LIALGVGLAIAIVFDFVLRTVRAASPTLTGKKLDVVLRQHFSTRESVKMAQRPSSIGILANQMREFDSGERLLHSGSVVSATDLLFAVLFVARSLLHRGAVAWIPLVMLPLMIVTGI